MSNETNAANVSILSLTGGGIIGIVNQYQVMISISIAVIGLLMGLFFHILAVKHRNKIEKRATEEYRRKLKEELIEELFKEDRLDK